MADYCSKPDMEYPDQPVLQFWTWFSFLHIVALEDSTPVGGLCRYDIADQTGDWCGSIMLDEKWAQDRRTSQCDFIAISDAFAFTLEECPLWTYYIPKERGQSEWDIFYVLLIEREKRGDLKWQRVALGKIFKAAFSQAEWKEIILG